MSTQSAHRIARGKSSPASNMGSFAAHSHGVPAVALDDHATGRPSGDQGALFDIEVTSKTEDCPECNGRGEIFIVDHETGHSTENCDFCKGLGEVGKETAAHWREMDALARADAAPAVESATSAAAAAWPGYVDLDEPPF